MEGAAEKGKGGNPGEGKLERKGAKGTYRTVVNLLPKNPRSNLWRGKD